jgi:hypothetical protein
MISYQELYEKYQKLLEENKRLRSENFKQQLRLELQKFDSEVQNRKETDGIQSEQVHILEQVTNSERDKKRILA